VNVYREKDARREVLESKRIAVIGYGSQGHAHALNLHDSGYDVVVGLRRDSAHWCAATDAGLRVQEPAAAVRDAAVVMVLIPDEVQPEVYTREIAPNLRPGAYLGFAHGFAIHFRRVVPPENVNVFLVAPKGPGRLVRRQYQEGSGVPCLIAVHQNPAGDTRDVALAYACGIGGGRAAVLETNFREETETDLFGEQAVLCGGLSELIRSGFETLVAAGYAPEMAYFECVHEVKLIVDLIHERGIVGMREAISNTAKYGDYTRGKRVIDAKARETMRKLLDEIQSGKFADEWMAEHAAGKPNMKQWAAEAAEHQVEEVGAQLRALMPWLKAATLSARGEPRPAEKGPPPPDPVVKRSAGAPAAGRPTSHASPVGHAGIRWDTPIDNTGCDWPGFEDPPAWFRRRRSGGHL
jgi:ketol-acid reductoisomerase